MLVLCMSTYKVCLHTMWSRDTSTLPMNNGFYYYGLSTFLLVHIVAWFSVVFGINSTSKVGIIAQGVAECNSLPYECF